MGEREGLLVSVVIPTYNRNERLKRAIKSVAQQTYEPIELIVVDDYSDVPAEEHLTDNYDRRFERFEVIRHDENRGGSAARNTGIRAASGDYIALLDDDDRWKPEKIERQVETVIEEDVGVVTTGVSVIGKNGNTAGVFYKDGIPRESPKLTKRLLCRNIVGSCSTVMVDADVIEAAGTFDERFPNWQDLEWYIRLSRHCRFGVVSEPLFIYYRDTGNRVSEDVDAMMNVTYPLFLEKFRPMATKYGVVFERKMRAWTAYRAGKQLVQAGRVEEGRRFLTRSIRLYPFEARFYKLGVPALGGTPTYEAAKKTKRAFDGFL